MIYWQKGAVQDYDKQSQSLLLLPRGPPQGEAFLLRDWIETNETISTEFNYFKSIRTGLYASLMKTRQLPSSRTPLSPPLGLLRSSYQIAPRPSHFHLVVLSPADGVWTAKIHPFSLISPADDSIWVSCVFIYMILTFPLQKHYHNQSKENPGQLQKCRINSKDSNF